MPQPLARDLEGDALGQQVARVAMAQAMQGPDVFRQARGPGNWLDLPVHYRRPPRLAEGLTEDEIQVAPKVRPMGELLLALPRAQTREFGREYLRNGDLAPAGFALRLRPEPELAVGLAHDLADLDHVALQIDIDPAQAQQLAASETAGQRRQDEREVRRRLCGLDIGRKLLGRRRPRRRPARRRRLGIGRRVLRDHAPPASPLEAIGNNAVDDLHGALRERPAVESAALRQLHIGDIEIVGAELGELDAADQRRDLAERVAIAFQRPWLQLAGFFEVGDPALEIAGDGILAAADAAALDQRPLAVHPVDGRALGLEVSRVVLPAAAGIGRGAGLPADLTIGKDALADVAHGFSLSF